MPYKITGTLNGRIKVRTRKTLGEAAAKARSMQIDAIRDVRVFQDDGQEVDPGLIASITRNAEHLGRVQSLRKWGWSLIWAPFTACLPLTLIFLIKPSFIFDAWQLFLFCIALPLAAGPLFLRAARKVERAGPNPPAAALPSPPAPPAANSRPVPAPHPPPGH